MEEKYNGFWAETEWIYEFRKDGTFKFSASGHYDTNEYNGRYIISDSTVFLNPDTDWQTFDGVLKPRLKIINKECLRDYDNNFYCKNYEIIDKLNDQELEFQTKTISILATLPIVRKEKERLMKIKSDNGSDNNSEVRIRYSGIIVVDRKEFHQFLVEKVSLFDTWGNLDFIVSKKPFEIYEHLSRRDSLRLIQKVSE